MVIRATMRELRLANDIPVILQDMKGTQVVTALVLFKVGSRNETKGTNGISHFLEHLFFKGTEHRPTTLDISKELDGVGADYNAFTSKDYTGYYVKVAKQHAGLAIDLLEDILFHPLFDPEEVDRERGVIVEEMNMYEDNPMLVAEELSEQLMFGANHPLGFRIAGPPKNILSVPRSAILNYRETYYHPGNMVIVLAGSLPKNIGTMVRQRFAVNNVSVKKTPAQKKFSFAQRAARLELHHKKTAQAHLALSFPGPRYGSTEEPVAHVLSTILGGTMSSRLFINVRERMGLCYYIRSGITPYQDMGAFTIQAGFDVKRIHEATAAIIEQVVNIRDHRVDPEELHKAKEFMYGKTSLRMEDSENVATWWARQSLFYASGRKPMLSPQQALARIESVTAAQVQALARKTLDSHFSNLVIVGPYTASQQQAFKKHLSF